MVNIELEKGILGKIIILPYLLVESLDKGLKEEYFLNEQTNTIFKKMLKVFDVNSKFDPSLLKLEQKKMIELGDYSTNVVHIDLAIKQLKENYRNSVLDNKIRNILTNDKKETAEKQSEIMAVIDGLQNFETEQNKFYDMKELSTQWWKSLENKKVDGIRTSYKDLDNYFIFESGSLVTIGARPAMGKTAFGLNLASRNAVKESVLYVNLEMSTNQISNRILSSMSGVSLKKIINKTLNDEEAGKIASKMEIFENLNLSLLDCRDSDFTSIVQKIRRMYEKKQFKLIVIDYLTLLHVKKYKDRNTEVEYMANRLKLLATELNTCIVILAQLNRQVELRADKKPVLSDLRDSGGIEQASNVVMFLYRADYYYGKDEEEPKPYSSLEVLIRKNRNGQTGNVVLAYNKETQSIVNAKVQMKIGQDMDEKRRLYE